MKTTTRIAQPNPTDPHASACANIGCHGQAPGAMAKRSAAMPCGLDAPVANQCHTINEASHIRRRGSVLVLVMALLSILFVLGITFMATMSFEADMIAAEKRRGGGEQGADTLSDGFSGALRGGFIDSGGSPFGGSGENGSGATFAELPGVHNVFSSIEPINMPNLPNSILPNTNGDGISGTNDDLNPAFATFTDASRGKGIRVPHGVLLSSDLRNGESVPRFLPQGASTAVSLIVCRGGSNRGFSCDPDAPADCPGSICSGPIAVDADGDGIVDSFLSDAADAGLSPDQIAKLSVEVNEAGSEQTDVFVGLRVIPHGGMANLNASHPTIIEAALGLSDVGQKLIDADGSANYFSLMHRPSGTANNSDSRRSLYSPSTEESLLRRRGIIPPRIFPPSTLQGDPFLEDWETIAPFIPFGGDMANFLFWPKGNDVFETVVEDDHRFDMFSPQDRVTGSTLLWGVRMEPFMAQASQVSGDEYDRRHLVTTVSHDDLLARGGLVATDGAATGGQDIITKMFEINRASAESDGDCPALFPFEYPRYPHELPDAGDCCNPGSGLAQFDQCDRNIRKGRLQVSFGWIDRQLAEVQRLVNDNEPLLARQMNERIKRVVYDAFFMMVNNAVGKDLFSRKDCDSTDGFACDNGGVCKLSTMPNAMVGSCTDGASYFDDVECDPPGPNAPQCADDEYCSPIDYTPNLGGERYYCSDKWTGLRRSEARLTRTAASLTANFFDFADGDTNPTAIPIRMMDFNPILGLCAGGDEPGRVCTENDHCGVNGLCSFESSNVGSNFDFDEDLSVLKGLYVYGLERQPYITEVAALQVKDATTNSAWWIELFNPYDQAISLNEYRIRQYDENDDLQGDFQLVGMVPPNVAGGPPPFAVLANGMSVNVPLTNTISVPGLSFKEGWTLYLIRRVLIPDENRPFTKLPVDIVVDQFTVPPGVGKEGTACQTDPECLFAAGRGATQTIPWIATVPTTFGPIDTHTFGDWNLATNNVHPVEVNFANSASVAVSFPTTGSMLLLMRHANRAIGDRDGAPPVNGLQLQPIADLAFTTNLVGEQAGYSVQGLNDTTARTVMIQREQQIDNGRMPIFDLGEDPANSAVSTSAAGPQAVHHVPAQRTPAWDPFDPNFPQVAGGKENLPWGQLVFDYFTAIPLDSPGPFPPCAGINGQDPPCKPAGSPDAKPRVDLDGLRVHGRINLNAAPATVLQGLPLVPMQDIPNVFRDQVRTALGVTVPDTTAEPIGFYRAQAIVAYRDARSVNVPDPNTGLTITTGDYGLPNPLGGSNGGRSWRDVTPTVRRGTGFMSVGEIANVRHEDASPSMRLDNMVVNFNTGNNNSENFITAAAFLIALNDWATVRSHVFTVYGHIRGAENEEIVDPDEVLQAQLRREDVDSRALRFQETIDRLPTFLGKSLPVRIGNRTVGAYMDESND